MVAGFRNSWWVHLASLFAIILMIALMFARLPWPSRVPAHFDIHWRVDRWGSPWESAIFPPLAMVMLVAGLVCSAAWSAREEGRKRFNITLPLIAIPLGAIVGLHGWFWWNLAKVAASGYAPHPWIWMGIGAIMVALATIVLEYLRKPMVA